MKDFACQNSVQKMINQRKSDTALPLIGGRGGEGEKAEGEAEERRRSNKGCQLSPFSSAQVIYGVRFH